MNGKIASVTLALALLLLAASAQAWPISYLGTLNPGDPVAGVNLQPPGSQNKPD